MNDTVWQITACKLHVYVNLRCIIVMNNMKQEKECKFYKLCSYPNEGTVDA